MQNKLIQFRAATAADYDVVFDLFSEVQLLHYDAHPEFFKTPSKDKFFRGFYDRILKSEAHDLILGYLEGDPIGYIQFFKGMRPETIYAPEHHVLYVNQLAVKEGYRYQRHGEAFIDYVKQIARSLEIKRIGIDFWLFNGPARKCFTRQGFRAFQEVMWFQI